MPLVQCRLCLEYNADIVNIYETRCQGISLRIIIHKLFSLKLKSDDGTTFLCYECNRILNECYSFYEKVQKAQQELSEKKSESAFIPVEVIKEELSAGINLEDDLLADDSGLIKEEDYGDEFYLKSEFQQSFDNSGDQIDFGDDYDGYKDELLDPDFQGTSDSLIRKKLKKKKKSSSKRKKDLDEDYNSLSEEKQKKKVKKRVKKEDNKKEEITTENDEDPKVLINENGAFIVKRNALEALINKFFNLDCEMCTETTRTFPTVRELFVHYDVQHKTKGYVKCCDSQFRIRKSINNHLARHLQPSAFECHICKKSVTRPEDLKYHIESHLPEAQRSLQCDQCEKRFAYPSHLRLHKYSHTPMEKRQIHQCKICNKVFTLPIFLSIHMSAKHTAKYLCPHCGKKYKEKNHYQNHLRAHNPTDADKVECKECGKVLSHEDGLRRHMRRHSVTLTCPQCSYIAHRNAELNKHIRIRHTDLKPHVCVVCGKAFKLKRSCNVHMAQHTGERNYTCPFCARTFVDPANCYSHQRKMHPVEFKNKVKLK